MPRNDDVPLWQPPTPGDELVRQLANSIRVYETQTHKIVHAVGVYRDDENLPVVKLVIVEPT